MALHIVWLTPKWWGPREVTLRVNYKQPPCNDAHTKSKNVWHIHVFYCTSSSTLATLLPIPQQAAVATGERTMRFSGDLARFRTAREGRCRLARSFSSGILDCLIHLFLIHTLWSGDRRSCPIYVYNIAPLYSSRTIWYFIAYDYAQFQLSFWISVSVFDLIIIWNLWIGFRSFNQNKKNL